MSLLSCLALAEGCNTRIIVTHYVVQLLYVQSKGKSARTVGLIDLRHFLSG